MKRLVDVLLVAAASPAWIPAMILLALVVRVRLGSPVLFTQRRPGLNGRLFRLVKFRTMTNGRGSDDQPLPDAERLTRFGRWLRATSLDELPELWNVLAGDMSLVGPRPLREEYLPLYSPDEARRHEVRPGITGWAQINGRNAIGWEARFALDTWYVDHRSLWLDLRILFRTVGLVLTRDGISHDRHDTMPWFTRSERRDG